MDKLGTGSVRKNVNVAESKFYKLDISRSFSKELVENTDLILNFAAESHVDRSITDPYSFYKNNVGLIM
ncbi:MAG: GDP-mannose 4,6-dehydratase, partial [Caldisphaera sp.]